MENIHVRNELRGMVSIPALAMAGTRKPGRRFGFGSLSVSVIGIRSEQPRAILRAPPIDCVGRASKLVLRLPLDIQVITMFT
jgi:hypothetical protein